MVAEGDVSQKGKLRQAGDSWRGFRVYGLTWLALLLLTLAELAVVSTAMSGDLLLAVLLVLTALKLLLIAYYFMHLKREHTGIVLIFLLPLLAGLVVYFGIAPDFGLFFGTP